MNLSQANTMIKTPEILFYGHFFGGDPTWFFCSFSTYTQLEYSFHPISHCACCDAAAIRLEEIFFACQQGKSKEWNLWYIWTLICTQMIGISHSMVAIHQKTNHQISLQHAQAIKTISIKHLLASIRLHDLTNKTKAKISLHHCYSLNSAIAWCDGTKLQPEMRHVQQS